MLHLAQRNLHFNFALQYISNLIVRWPKLSEFIHWREAVVSWKQECLQGDIFRNSLLKRIPCTGRNPQYNSCRLSCYYMKYKEIRIWLQFLLENAENWTLSWGGNQKTLKFDVKHEYDSVDIIWVSEYKQNNENVQKLFCVSMRTSILSLVNINTINFPYRHDPGKMLEKLWARMKCTNAIVTNFSWDSLPVLQNKLH